VNPAPRLSVVIPVYNNWWLTARALRALESLRDTTLPFETIVIDNASSDETPNAIAAFPWVRYVAMEHNRNFAGACNAGARLAEAPIVAFLNNDAYPLGDALTPLVQAFDDSHVFVAGGALFFEDGVTQCAGFVVLPNAHWHYSCRNFPSSLDSVAQSRDALGVSGAAMAVRAQWFLDEGGFDESYINGFEDVDLCMRARERGCGIRYVADARFAHYEAASSGRYDREAQNEAAFYRRWAPSFLAIPRTARGEVGAISVLAPPDMTSPLAAGLDDLEQALRAFGHPIVRGGVRVWQRLDRRFRRHASLEWFTPSRAGPGVAVERRAGALAAMHVRGVVELCVPWLPCAADARVAGLPLRASLDPACATVAVAGFEGASAQRKREIAAALLALAESDPALEVIALASETAVAEIAPSLGNRLRVRDPGAGEGTRAGVACVVQVGFTDDGAFGNVALAQSGIATVACGDELAALFTPDVALVAADGELSGNVKRLLNDARARMRYGALLAADARRRFSPRRSAIRVVDLLCAARFGLERPARARTNSPLTR
jgi:GT2 family glycosyltransferase